ncbi:MAG: Crp/Fnr family transcriptional regulator [Actinomycetota bacterium]|nr:Crp/Fnr family transcriptional regulator [Actinomycetota bacterium]
MEWVLLSPVSADVREQVLAAARPRRFARGEVIFHEGDPGDCLHLIQSGRMAISVSMDSGESATLRILGPTDAFGELALLGGGIGRPRTATVTALESAATLALSRQAFASLCAKHPEVERLVVSLLAERVDQLSQRLLEVLYVGVDRRVYRRLVELADIYGPGMAAAVIPLTQDDLAGLAGATRPTVNKALQRLADSGLVRLHRGTIEVTDVQALQDRDRR